MKTNYFKMMIAAVVGVFLLCHTLQADATAKDATPITKEEAAKKFPQAKGHYPMGEFSIHSPRGWISSPYPPHDMYNCSKIPGGGLVLDTHVNRVFVRP